MHPLKLLKVILIAGTVALSSVALSATGVLAYGQADQPLAQIELSANCNNPDFGLCQEVGLGGIWFWIEIDADGTGDIAGAGCAHTIGGPRGGAFPIRGEVTWESFSGSPADLQAAGFFAFGVDPGGNYYTVTLFPGEGFAFPKTVGHYSFKPVAGVTIQLQVAP
jgi:hypothetical protein